MCIFKLYCIEIAIDTESKTIEYYFSENRIENVYIFSTGSRIFTGPHILIWEHETVQDSLSQRQGKLRGTVAI